MNTIQSLRGLGHDGEDEPQFCKSQELWWGLSRTDHCDGSIFRSSLIMILADCVRRRICTADVHSGAYYPA
jgi:hypothetical protein